MSGHPLVSEIRLLVWRADPLFLAVCPHEGREVVMEGFQKNFPYPLVQDRPQNPPILGIASDQLVRKRARKHIDHPSDRIPGLHGRLHRTLSIKYFALDMATHASLCRTQVRRA